MFIPSQQYVETQQTKSIKWWDQTINVFHPVSSGVGGRRMYIFCQWQVYTVTVTRCGAVFS